MIVEIIGLFGGLALLVWLTLRGMELLVAAPLCSLLVALTSGLAIFARQGQAATPSFTAAYMSGFCDFIAAWFFMFLLGALFGKLIEASGAADSIARRVIGRLGHERAALAVVLACAVLTYGGVSVFVVAFCVYPMAVSLFRAGNVPRRFLPAALAFGSITFTMTSAGSPEIQNWIPVRYLQTSPWAGWQVSLPVAVAMFVSGQWWLSRAIRAAKASGESFEVRADDPLPSERQLPTVMASVLPLLVVLGLSFGLHAKLNEAALLVSLSAGIAVGCIVHRRHLRHTAQTVAAAATGALLAIGNTAAVVGFAAVAKESGAFQLAVQWVSGMPGDPLVGAALSVGIIAALAGSASGGQAIALPIVSSLYVSQGVDPSALHRIVAISSGSLDSLPHNGYVVTTVRAICRERFAAAYPAMAVLTVVIPLLGLAAALLLFSLR